MNYFLFPNLVMLLKNSALGKWVRIIAMKIERTGIPFLSDVWHGGPSPSLDFYVSTDYKETSCTLRQGNPVKTRFPSCTWYPTFAFACYSKVRYIFVLVYWYCVRRTLFIAYLRTIFFNARYMATAADADVRTILHKNFSIVIFLVGYRVSAIIWYTPLKKWKIFWLYS